MTELLIKYFVKDFDKVQNAEVRECYGKFCGIVGIFTNILLFGIKIFAGVVFHSVAITADAINNLSDSASSIVTLVGFKLSGKPADEEHPFGHQRIEYVSALIVSLVILMIGFQLLQSSFGKALHPEPAEFSVIAIAILIVSILIKLWQYMFYRKIAKRIASTALEAASMDSRNDVISTAVILFGIFLTRLTGFNMDGWMGLAVAMLIIISGVKLIQESTNPLLGEAPTRKLVDQVYEKIKSYDGVLGIHDLEVHNYGPSRCFASVHCEVSAAQDIMVSHDIIDNIERDFLKEMNIHLVIHLDPVVTDDEQTNHVKHQMEMLLHQISPSMSMHDFRVVWGTTHSNLIFDVCVPFGFAMTDEEICQCVEKEAKKLNSNFYTVITVDHSYVPLQEEIEKNE